MKLSIIAVNKLREAYYRAAVSDYLQRIRRFLPVDEIEVPPGTDEDSNGRGRAALLKEAENIERRMPKTGRVVALDKSGRMLSTEDFSAWLEEAMNASVPHITFVIGGAWGLSPRLCEKADLVLSLSQMTLPHELARVVLAEQIYRALSLWKGLPYHK